MKQRHRIPALIPVLVGVSILFIGILIYAYVESKKANPQMLDEHGRVRPVSLARPGAGGQGSGARAVPARLARGIRLKPAPRLLTPNPLS